jgi:hypothetical protein
MKLQKQQQMKGVCRRLVIGDALAVNRLSTTELKMLMSQPYSLYILPEVLAEVRESTKEQLLSEVYPARIKHYKLNASEKIRANLEEGRLGNWRTDNYSLFLARKLNAPMLVGDECWRLQAKDLQDVKLVHTDRQGLFIFLMQHYPGFRRRINIVAVEVESKKAI